MADVLTIQRRTFISLVSQLISGNPNPDDPNEPHGPIGPVVRKAYERMSSFAKPEPEPWVQVALNPQPLPPRMAFSVALAQEVIEKAVSLSEMADALPREVRGQTQEFAVNFVSRFIDDCGNGRIVPWKRPPGPFPHFLGDKAVNGIELVVIGAQLANSASLISNERLRQSLLSGSSKLMETGLSQM